ncbi:MAG: class II aldolase/adducin family protein [Oscillospiraceae bacterium]
MDERQEVFAACKKMYNQKLVAGTSGNISMRKRGAKGDTFFIKPSGKSYEDMLCEDIVEIDGEGNPIAKGQVPSSEWRMHIEIYKRYPEVNAVLHTHSPFATGFGVNRQEIPLILIEMKPFLGGSVRVAPFAAAGSVELAQSILPYLEDRTACLLANHGVVAVGSTMEKAYTAAEYVEDAAKIYYYAKTSGTPVVIEG